MKVQNLDVSPLICNLFSDAISSRQLLMTVRLCHIINKYPKRHLLRVHFYLSTDRFSLRLELVKERERLDLKDLAKY